MTYNMMFLGDSITHGVVNSGNTESGGYRTQLWNLFQADNFDVDFVGLQSNGPLNIDRNHHGHRGWRIDEIMNGNTRIAGQDTVGNIDDWLNPSNPNVKLPNAVFLMIGTNDILQDYQLNTAANRLSQLIDKIMGKVPDANVFVSSLLPINNSTDNQQVQQFNAKIPDIVNNKAAAGDKVSFVDINSKLTTSDLADGVHPTIDGFNKIANAWYDAFLPVSNIKKTIRIQAEDMTLTNYLVESNNSSALGRKLISLYGSAVNTGTASYQFAGKTGSYDLVLGYYDENDGKSTLGVKIDNTEVDQWTLDKYFNSGGADHQTKTRRTVAKGINLTSGTKIEITGTANQSEFARVDYLELIPIEINVDPPSTPVNTSLSANSISTPNDTTYTFSVTYINDEGIDVSSFDASDVRVTGPNGFDCPAELVNVDHNSNGTPRTATYRIHAPGGIWDIADNGTYNVVLQANQVTDISGNSFASNSLGTFLVNIPQPQTTIRIEAENMQATNYLKETNSAASNSQVVSLYQSGSTTGTIKTNFTGDSGTYDVILRYFDEADGQAILTTRINGTQINQSILNQYLGSNSATSQTAVTKTIASGLSINQGTNIEIEGILNKDEFARIDYIEFKPVTPPSAVDLTKGIDLFKANLSESQNAIRIETENMQRTGYVLETNSAASNNQVVSLYQSGNTTGTLKTIFTGDSGTYDVVLRYFDEADGQAMLTTRIGGTQIDQSILNQYLGSNSATSQTAVTKTIASGLSINQGANIEIEGILNQGEFARVDYIEFKPVSVTSTSMPDLINGTDVADILTGNSANDIIRGYDGSDSINGGDGNDMLIGGKGNDTLTGGNGQDVFGLAVGDGADTVTDFTDNQDKLGLYGGLKFSQLTISQGTGDNLNDTLIMVKNSGELLANLKEVQVSMITSSDFILV